MQKRNNAPQPQADTRQLRVMASPLYHATLRNFANNTAVLKAIRQFLEFKRAQPLTPYGAKDYPFRGNGPLHGYGHAGLTFDASVVYNISGRDPRIMKLYGVYTHDQLGIGNPGKPAIQKKSVDSFGRQTFTPLDKIDESSCQVNSPLLNDLLKLI